MNFFDTWTRRISEAREALKVDIPNMASLLRVTPREVEAWEGGEQPSPEHLGRYAQLLGVEFKEFYRAGVDDHNPMRLLFRHARQESDALGALLQVKAFVPPEAVAPLGEFVRQARRLQRLEQAMGRATGQDKLDQISPTPLRVESMMDKTASRHAALQGGALAKEAREAWGLQPSEPIHSMTEWMERELGAPIFYDATLPEDIEAASARVPMAAVLVRWPVLEPWRLRITLAHELCHLLHDRGVLEPANPTPSFFNFSPTSSGGDADPHKKRRAPLWRGHFRNLYFLEQRARSFAASFIAPLSGVRALLASEGLAPDSGDAVLRIMDHYGVGLEVAINQIANAQPRGNKRLREELLVLFGLRQSLDRWRSYTPPLPPPAFPYQEQKFVPEASPHPRLMRAILDAAAQRKLSLSEAWGYAGRPVSEALAQEGQSEDPRLLRPLCPAPTSQGAR